MRLIDADALMGQLERKRSGPGNQRYTEGFNDALMRFRSMIHSASTIDAEPARHGRWIGFTKKYNGVDVYYVKCPVCGSERPFDYGLRYCNYCGTKMDGGDE